MDKSNNLSESVIFPKGEKLSEQFSKYFTGNTWLNMLVPRDNEFNCPIGNVTFEPGCRNNWHKHPGGQILLVTGGKGYYQEDGKPAQVIKEGDVVEIPPDVKHWHGATANRALAHLAITPTDKGETIWLEAVSDEEYKKLETSK